MNNYLDIADSSSMMKLMGGCLKTTIEAHGPITPEWIGSATKRLYAGLKVRAREQRMKNPVDPMDAAKAASIAACIDGLAGMQFVHPVSTATLECKAISLRGMTEAEVSEIERQFNAAIYPVQQQLISILRMRVAEKLGIISIPETDNGCDFNSA